MAQAGLHGIVGLAIRRWAPHHDSLLLGIVLGTMLPDADNIAVAVATLGGWPTAGLHRTFTHSLFTVATIVVAFALVARATGRSRWHHLGIGLGVGVLTHIAFDLLIWFNGVALLWPLPIWVDLWANVSPPEWWRQLMMPAEFLAFAAFFALLGAQARRRGTDAGFRRRLRPTRSPARRPPHLTPFSAQEYVTGWLHIPVSTPHAPHQHLFPYSSLPQHVTNPLPIHYPLPFPVLRSLFSVNCSSPLYTPPSLPLE